MRHPGVNKELRDGTFNDQAEMEQLVDSQYDKLMEEALKRNDAETLHSYQWGRLFLTQKYGYWVG